MMSPIGEKNGMCLALENLVFRIRILRVSGEPGHRRTSDRAEENMLQALPLKCLIDDKQTRAPR